MVRPKHRDTRRASLRAIAPGGVSGFQRLAFLRGGMIAAVPRAATASWRLRVGTVSGDAADLLIAWDLVEQFGQHGCIAHAAGDKLGCPDLKCFLVKSDADVAPDAPFRAAVPAGVPIAFALDLDPSAVDRQVQRAR